MKETASGLFLVCVSLWLSTAVIVENPLTSPVEFKIGLFKFDEFTSDRFILEVLKACSTVGVEPSYDHNEVFLLFKNMQGWDLREAASSRHHKYSFTNVSTALSHRLNACLGKVKSNEEKEVISHAALAVWPWNTYVHKNLLFYYEWHGYVGAMEALYVDSVILTGDESLLLQYIYAAPPMLYSIQQSQDIHIEMLRKYYEFVTFTSSSSSNPHNEIREFQQNILYIGYSTGIVMEMYMTSITHRYNDFFVQINQTSLLSPVAVADRSSFRHRIGVVSEHPNNGAPDLCIENIFKRVELICSRDDDDCISLDIIFFDRMGLDNEFSRILRRRAKEVYILDGNDVLASARTISQANTDVLLYIALPTEKFTILLSQFRLAKVQVVFGAGHPITSGSANIDYNIFSSSFVYDRSVLTKRSSPSNIDEFLYNEPDLPEVPFHCTFAFKCAQAAFKYRSFEALVASLPVCGSIGAIGSIIYTEQTIFLDSIGYFLQDSSKLYDDMLDVQLHRYLPTLSSSSKWDLNETDVESRRTSIEVGPRESLSCTAVDNMLSHWGLTPNITTSSFSIPCVGAVGGNSMKSKKRLYMCIQLNRKLHPLFDSAIKGILESDPLAVIAVSYKARVLVHRWKIALNYTDVEELYTRFVFVPKLQHPDYLKFVSFTTVFLNTFPFGAGVTTSEALSMCVPVLVLPDLVSTAQLALSQIRALGSEGTSVESNSNSGIERFLTAHSVPEYVVRATFIAGLVETNITELAQVSQRVTADAKSKLFEEMHSILSESSIWATMVHDPTRTIHSAFRQHMCTLKERLFSDAILSGVTAEWRQLLVRLATT